MYKKTSEQYNSDNKQTFGCFFASFGLMMMMMMMMLMRMMKGDDDEG